MNNKQNELNEILINFASFFPYKPEDLKESQFLKELEEAKTKILNLLISKLPERKTKPKGVQFGASRLRYAGYNQALDEVLSIIKDLRKNNE